MDQSAELGSRRANGCHYGAVDRPGQVEGKLVAGRSAREWHAPGGRALYSWLRRAHEPQTSTDISTSFPGLSRHPTNRRRWLGSGSGGLGGAAEPASSRILAAAAVAAAAPKLIPSPMGAAIRASPRALLGLGTAIYAASMACCTAL